MHFRKRAVSNVSLVSACTDVSHAIGAEVDSPIECPHDSENMSHDGLSRVP